MKASAVVDGSKASAVVDGASGARGCGQVEATEADVSEAGHKLVFSQ